MGEEKMKRGKFYILMSGYKPVLKSGYITQIEKDGVIMKIGIDKRGKNYYGITDLKSGLSICPLLSFSNRFKAYEYITDYPNILNLFDIVSKIDTDFYKKCCDIISNAYNQGY